MKVCKLHALGNDFLVVQADRAHLDSEKHSPLAAVLCDRHYGFGADGVMLLADAPDPASGYYAVRILNADGSEAEMSGNGVRCAAAYLIHFGGVTSTPIRFETKAGLRVARFLDRKDLLYFFETDMGRPVLASPAIPMLLPNPMEPVVRCPLSVDGRTIEITSVSMGNPHCVLFFDQWKGADSDLLGAQLSNHPAFPNRTNVEFVQVLSRDAIRVAFWERGVGRTFSSGTGSSGAAVASILNGYTDEVLTVYTASGKLKVDWRGRRELRLTGPAEVLYRGEFYLPEQSSCELY